MRLSEEDEKKLTPSEQELARAVYASIKESGVNLDYRRSLPEVKHHCEQECGAEVKMRLPFDVEVHQLDGGHRMVLDTHRLLMPDVLWMDWMQSDEAKPRVWAVDIRSIATPTVHYGQLDSLCISYHSQSISIEMVRIALQQWWDSAGVMAGTIFESDSLHHQMDTGCVCASATNSCGQVVAVVMLACPRWYYSGPAAMTCLLPPEAAHRLKELDVDGKFEGLSPDLIMAGDREATKRGRDCISQLYAVASVEILDRYRDEVAIEICLTDVDVYADPVAHRRVLKRLMHSLGLGLRHARLLVDQLEDDSEIRRVLIAIAFGKRSASQDCELGLELDSSAGVKAWATSVARLFASIGVNVSTGLSPSATSPYLACDTAASRSCVGTELAAAGGLHMRKPI